MKKGIKYLLIAVCFVLLAYNSVYVKKLSDMKKTEEKAFDAYAYAKDFLYKKVPAGKDKALDLSQLLADLKNNPRQAFSNSHAQNNGDIRFFMVKGKGQITRIDDSNTYLSLPGSSAQIALATEYIIGNAARDGSGIISVDEFTTTMDMNTVSEELNKLIRAEVLPPFEAKAKQGDIVDFTGCIELNQARSLPDTIEVIPLILEVK
ncbi:DUF2291 domain-containing protein [Desertivirga xinjiangensis]|uniref:DUF2291 domain-containing protein n=1 Tax=Desertivirga xinjiangensis TaxID=539206 RepID=UPI00210A13EB|nr:DUF2291 domain-containing protein [Pedobacter xinjiangensis]